MMETRGMEVSNKTVSHDPHYDEGPRQVELVVHRIHPWSTMKTAFLLSVLLGIAMVIATVLVWLALDSMHVFASIQRFVGNVDATSTVSPIMDFLRLPRVVALATVIAVLNTVLLTVLATVGAMLYNVIASLIGGVKVSLIDE